MSDSSVVRGAAPVARRLHVFLSHLTVESKLADFLQRHISRDFIGLVEVFVSSDRLAIPVGAKWLEEVVAGLRQSDLHLILCSPESVGRPWINYEAGAARVRGVPIVPICHSRLLPEQLPVPLSESEAVMATDPEGLKALYRAIAAHLESEVPDVSFAEYAADAAKLEAEHLARGAGVVAGTFSDSASIRNPRVLCITSPQFLELGAGNQLDLVEKAFPPTVVHERVQSLGELREALTKGNYDIVHVAAFVCPRSGDVYFSEVDVRSGYPITRPPELVEADQLAAWLGMSRTRLVVIGSSDSLALGATLVSITNVVATRDMVSPPMTAKWIETFYGSLQKESLPAAFNLALMASSAPMRLYPKLTLPEARLA